MYLLFNVKYTFTTKLSTYINPVTILDFTNNVVYVIIYIGG